MTGLPLLCKSLFHVVLVIIRSTRSLGVEMKRWCHGVNNLSAHASFYVFIWAVVSN